MPVFCWYETHCTRVRFTVILWCSDELAIHICPLLCLQRRVAKVASGFFYCWSLLRNNNMATNLQRFTLHYGSRRFVAWDCWTCTSWQVMQRGSDMLIVASHVRLYFVKRSRSDSTAMLSQVWTIHYICESVTNVPERQTILTQASFHAVQNYVWKPDELWKLDTAKYSFALSIHSDVGTKPYRLRRILTSLHRCILTSHIILYCMKRSLRK